MNLEPDEETFNASEDVDEDIFAPDNAFSRLTEVDGSKVFARE